MCHGPLSREPYKGDLLHFGGRHDATTSATAHTEVAGTGFYAIINTERICGSPGGITGAQHGGITDLTGENTVGGKTIYAFFNNLFKDV